MSQTAFKDTGISNACNNKIFRQTGFGGEAITNELTTDSQVDALVALTDVKYAVIKEFRDKLEEFVAVN